VGEKKWGKRSVGERVNEKMVYEGKWEGSEQKKGDVWNRIKALGKAVRAQTKSFNKTFQDLLEKRQLKREFTKGQIKRRHAKADHKKKVLKKLRNRDRMAKMSHKRNRRRARSSGGSG